MPASFLTWKQRHLPKARFWSPNGISSKTERSLMSGPPSMAGRTPPCSPVPGGNSLTVRRLRVGMLRAGGERQDRSRLPHEKRMSGLVVLQELTLGAGKRVIERVDKSVGVDEIAGPLLPRSDDLFLLHLIESLVRLDG